MERENKKSLERQRLRRQFNDLSEQLIDPVTRQNFDDQIEKLKDYKSKKLEHHQMSLIADMLSIDDIKNVSKWYSSIKIEIEDIEK